MILGGGTPLSATCNWTRGGHFPWEKPPSTFCLQAARAPISLGAMARAECQCLWTMECHKPLLARVCRREAKKEQGTSSGSVLSFPSHRALAVTSGYCQCVADSQQHWEIQCWWLAERWTVTVFTPNLISHPREKRSCGNKAKCWELVFSADLMNIIIWKDNFYLAALCMLFWVQNYQYAFKNLILNPSDKLLIEVIWAVKLYRKLRLFPIQKLGCWAVCKILILPYTSLR